MNIEKFKGHESDLENEILLFSYFRSSSSWRVRTILNLKKIKHKLITVHLLKDEQKSEYYKKYNPSGYLPCLYIQKNNLSESMAISEFLEEQFPNSFPLLPKNCFKRAKIRQICEIVNSGIQPLQNLCVIRDIEKMYKGDKIEWGKKWNVRGLKIIDGILKESKGKYCVGDDISLADCFLVPQFKGAVDRFGLDPEEFPNINEVFKNLNEIPEFVEAYPENQPDWPKKD